MKRRDFNKGVMVAMGAGLMGNSLSVVAKNYLSIDQARSIIWPGVDMRAFEVKLSEEQARKIKKSSKTRVRNKIIKGYRSSEDQWLIIDQVIGKHEFIDLAVGIQANGFVKGIEVLSYRESYGGEIMNPKWRAQFHGKSSATLLTLDDEIKNISGATMSCKHVTDGINRLTHTWEIVLQNL